MSNEYGDVVWLEINRIDHRPASEVRAGTNEESVGRYAESFDDLPPLLVTVDADGRHWLDDGYHRYCAADRLGREAVACRTRIGTYLDAFAAACHANDKHGLQATNADKRRRVELALNDPVMKDWSQGRIAELCGVSQPFVSKYDDRPTHNGYELDGAPPRTIGRDGRSRPARMPRPRAEPVGPDPVAEEAPAPARNGFHREEVVIEFTPPSQTIEGPRCPASPEPTTVRDADPAVEAEPVATAADSVPVEDAPATDWDAWWRSYESRIRRDFDSLPPEARSFFADNLRSLAGSLLSLCPDVVDRTHELLT